MSNVHVARLHPSLGAEVSGVDLSRPVDATIREELTRALAEHLALVFHDQSLTPFNGLDGHQDTREEDRAKYGHLIEHPMVRTHPVHGSRAVYFHVSKTDHVSGMTPEASQRYLRELLDRMIQPEIVYLHQWR